MTDYFDLNMTDAELREVSNLALAHVGDAVYELMIRTYLCKNGGVTSKELHTSAITYVSAPAQARAAGVIEEALTSEELAVFRRGRNARVNSVPHGATISQYHAATGVETLFGWLYLRGMRERLNVLFGMIMKETDGN